MVASGSVSPDDEPTQVVVDLYPTSPNSPVGVLPWWQFGLHANKPALEALGTGVSVGSPAGPVGFEWLNNDTGSAHGRWLNWASAVGNHLTISGQAANTNGAENGSSPFQESFDIVDFGPTQDAAVRFDEGAKSV